MIMIIIMTIMMIMTIIMTMTIMMMLTSRAVKSVGAHSSESRKMSRWSGSGTSRAWMHWRRVDLPLPFAPERRSVRGGSVRGGSVRVGVGVGASPP